MTLLCLRRGQSNCRSFSRILNYFAIMKVCASDALFWLFSRDRGLLLGFILGHSIPVRGDWPNTMRQFIIQACHLQPTSVEEAHIPCDHQAEGDSVETKQTDDNRRSPFQNIYHKFIKPLGGHWHPSVHKVNWLLRLYAWSASIWYGTSLTQPWFSGI